MRKTFVVLVGVLVFAAMFAMQATAQTLPNSAGSSQKPVRIGYTMPTADHGYIARAIFWAKKAMADWKAMDPSHVLLCYGGHGHKTGQ